MIMTKKHVCQYMSLFQDTELIKIEAEKTLKYKDLTIEFQRMWNV
jgi:hypothetical protein